MRLNHICKFFILISIQVAGLLINKMVAIYISAAWSGKTGNTVVLPGVCGNDGVLATVLPVLPLQAALIYIATILFISSPAICILIRIKFTPSSSNGAYVMKT